jgi:hypothetical protein
MKVMFRILLLSIVLCFKVFSATLTFEGLPDGSPVGAFYNSLGVSFTGATALIDSSNGGSGNFGGEPSPVTAVFSSTNITIDSATGLISSIQFYLANPTGTTDVRVYSGVNLTGNVLVDVLLNATPSDGQGRFGPFVPNTVRFEGIGRSVVIFSRASGGFVIDDLTLTQTAEPVPEPQSLWFWPFAGLCLAVASHACRPSRCTE